MKEGLQRILDFLVDSGGEHTTRDIADRAGDLPYYTRNALVQLEKKGLVARRSVMQPRASLGGRQKNAKVDLWRAVK